MELLRNENKEGAEWLESIPPQHWSRAYFSGRAKTDMLLNNMCEVLNSKLVGGRDKPILTMLEYVREYLMRRIVNVLALIDKHDGLLVPYVTKLFEGIKKDAEGYIVEWNGGEQYQVKSTETADQVVVDMNKRTCACRRWEVTGIPCRHVVATIWNMAIHRKDVGNPESYIDPMYRVDRWKEVYSHHVFPINGSLEWPKSRYTLITAPLYHKPIGRPRKARKRSAIEMEEATAGGKLTRAGRLGKCSSCGKVGHNKATCKGQEGPST